MLHNTPYFVFLSSCYITPYLRNTFSDVVYPWCYPLLKFILLEIYIFILKPQPSCIKQTAIEYSPLSEALVCSPYSLSHRQGLGGKQIKKNLPEIVDS